MGYFLDIRGDEMDMRAGQPMVGKQIVTKTPERQALELQWAQRHGVDAAARLSEAEDFADAVRESIVPENTVDTYSKGWKVWQRFCATQRFPELEGSRGALVAFVTWLLREGRLTPGPGGTLGYAPTSAGSHLTAAVVGLRERGVIVTKDDGAAAREVLDGLTVRLLKAGERRGRGQAAPADLEGLRRIAEACGPTLTGRRDKALVLTNFHYASRASEPAGLLLADVQLQPKGLIVNVLTGKTKHSVRAARIPHGQDPLLCPVRAWTDWREALHAVDPAYDNPTDPAFHAIDRWGHVRGPMSPDAVTIAVARIAQRSGVLIRWTGHSLRSGLATEGRRKGKDSVQLAKQGGWAPNSQSMLGYMRTVDDWEDNASAGLA